MDDLKLHGKDEAQIDSLVKSVYTFSTDIGMEFGLTKCGVIIRKRGKVVKLDGIAIPTGEVMKLLMMKVTSTWEYWNLMKSWKSA